MNSPGMQQEPAVIVAVITTHALRLSQHLPANTTLFESGVVFKYEF